MNTYVARTTSVPRQNVVGIAGNDQLRNGSTHELCVIPRQNVTKITGGNRKRDGITILALASLKCRIEIINDLRQNTCPINGVDGTKLQLLLRITCEYGFDLARHAEISNN